MFSLQKIKNDASIHTSTVNDRKVMENGAQTGYDMARPWSSPAGRWNADFEETRVGVMVKQGYHR